MCNIILSTNKTVTTANTIFCGVWLVSLSHSWHVHGQSRKTTIQDNPRINAEKTNIHGSTHSGTKYEECATSGANKLITANTIGNTQQNKCGNTVAIIPSLIALFFMLFSCIMRKSRKTWRPQQESNLHQRFRKPPFYPIEL